MEVVNRLGYVPNSLGRNLRLMESKRLLVLLPTIQNPFYSPIINAFETYAWKKGFSTLFAVTKRSPRIEKNYMDILYSRQVDGLASFIPTIGNNEIRKIAKNFPYVAICWHNGNEVDTSYVCIDNAEAAFDMTNYLISLGHSKIAMLNGNNKERLFETDRDRGFRKALSEASLSLPPEYVITCDYGYWDGYRACEELLQLPCPPTAVFCNSDERAAGALHCVKDHGMTPGIDIDIVGFDNTSRASNNSPSITTVNQPAEEIGEEAARLLISLVHDNTRTRRGVVLRHSIVIRQSTRSSNNHFMNESLEFRDK